MIRWKRIVADTRPLGIVPFRRLWISTLVTAVGGMLTVVAVPLQIYQITSSSAYVGLTGLAGLAPLVVFALWGGAIADVVDRRSMQLVTTGGTAAVALLLWAQAAAAVGSVWVLLALFGLQQALVGASWTAQGASVARLVPADLLPAANALTSTGRQLGAIVGPLLAGAALPVIGLGPLYLVDAAALSVALWAVWKLPSIPPLGQAPGQLGLRSALRAVGAGFAYIATQKLLLMALLADVIAMVFGNPGALYPQLAQETFGDSPTGGPALGVLIAAFPLGYVLGGSCSGVVSRVRRHGAIVTVAVCVWGLMMVGLGLSRWLWLAVVFQALGGAAVFVLSMFRGTILQAAATDEMRGRMQGVLTIVSAGGPQLAAPLHGTAGAVVGTTWAISGGGVLVVLAMLTAVLAVPSFWRYRGADTTDTSRTAT